MNEVAEQVRELLNGAGRRIVEGNLYRQGLPAYLHDDLLQEALVRAWRAGERGEQVENYRRFTAELVRRAAIDMLRGRVRRAEVPIEAWDDAKQVAERAREPAQHDPEAAALLGEEVSHIGAVVDEIRRKLGLRLADPSPTRAAGGLAVLAIAHGDALPADDCPAPQGARGDEVAAWAGLFYGGEPDCFPTSDQPEDANMRKRRSRAIARIRALLIEASADLLAPAEDDDA